MSNPVKCPCGRVAKVAATKFPGLDVRIFHCPDCKKVHAEGDRWWIDMGDGWQEQLLDRCERVASEANRLKEFVDSDLDSPWFNSTEGYSQ